MYKRNIQRLTQTYWTLSVQDIAKNVQLSSPKEVEMHALQMVVSYAIILDAKVTAIIQAREFLSKLLDLYQTQIFAKIEIVELRFIILLSYAILYDTRA